MCTHGCSNLDSKVREYWMKIILWITLYLIQTTNTKNVCACVFLVKIKMLALHDLRLF